MESSVPRSFIDDLVSYFDQKQEVQAAYFAFLYSSVSQTHDLFLGVEHAGELEGIKKMSLFIKQVYLPQAPMFFASSEEDAELFATVREQGLQFFSRQEGRGIEQELLKGLFDQQRDRAELVGTVRNHGVYALVHKAPLEQKQLVVQSFSKDGEEFTPLFTSPDMLPLGGIGAPPAGMVLARLVWSKHLAGAAPRPVVLNPDTAFEARFEL
ncbi:SseB family protein [Hymenobacter cellulosilyticus]|uniref:SseB family protein n=1 Tax=Hymenobacter cellulosilyticus TaxID=2932248 RepID=A0A8T9Q4G2_9BACT|nr:SseB family protein [Hymenobacter cellulosilyticus]UOQ71852.1 SseB family protein [Hymenobacter cellulosilyticus]